MSAVLDTGDTVQRIHALLDTVCDPEIPVLTVNDLGVVRDVRVAGDGIDIDITPTYSGCPAMDTIAADIASTLRSHGYDNVRVHTVLSPAWTTDWLSDAGHEKLLAFGIVPPQGSASKRVLFGAEPQLTCPQCRSQNTEKVSEFGSTACKALYRCRDCLEPFDYFKCL